GAEPGEVAAGSREALNNALPDRVGLEYKNDRYRLRLLPHRRDRRRIACQNCVRLQADQFCRIGLEERWIARGKAIVDPDILPLGPPETSQRLCKGRHKCLSPRVGLGVSYHYADTANPLRLLRVPHERNRDRSAAEERTEKIPALHSPTHHP